MQDSDLLLSKQPIKKRILKIVDEMQYSEEYLVCKNDYFSFVLLSKLITNLTVVRKEGEHQH